MFAAGASDDAVATLQWNGRPQEVRSGEWILGVDPGIKTVRSKAAAGQVAGINRMLSNRGAAPGVVKKQLGRAGQYLLDLPDGTPYGQVLAAARQLPGFRYLEPNRMIRIDAVPTGAPIVPPLPNDEQFDRLYGLHNTGQFYFGMSKPDADIDAPEAWEITRGSSDVVVAVIDTGVDYNHPDLRANMWANPGEIPGNNLDDDRNGYVDDVHGINSITGGGDPMDDQDHGTHCAGTIGAAGNSGAGVAGVNWDVSIMGLKFLNDEGTGDTADAVECINYAIAMKQRGVNLKVLSNSWGSRDSDDALKDAVDASGRAGMLFVASAGNLGNDNDGILKNYPGSYDSPHIIAVAATDCWDGKPYWSNYGATTVDIGAPGDSVLSTTRNGGYQEFSGTSMAAPHVAGVAALAWGLKGDATWQEIKSAILSGADPIESMQGKVLTNGRLNAYRTLRALVGGEPNSIAGSVFDDADHDGSRGANEAGVGGVRVFLDANGNGRPDEDDRSYASANVPLPIPDVDKATSALTVAGAAGFVRDVDVTLDLNHTYVGDLRIYLIGPNGTRVELVNSVGGGEDDFRNTTFDDEADTPIGEGRAPFTGTFKPSGRLADFDGTAASGAWTLEVEDLVVNDSGTLNSWSLRIQTGEQSAMTNDSGGYAFAGLTPGRHVVRQVTPEGHTQTAPPGGFFTVDLAAGQAVTGRDFGNFHGTPPPPTGVAGRYVFYNRSLFDGNNPAANARDDNAIATDKRALRRGQTAGPEHITSYVRGINGVMVDITGLPAGAVLTAADFTFRFGNDDSPAEWAAAPEPTAVALRRGAGASGADRVTLTWRDGAIRNGWLEVTVLPTVNTGLSAPDVFYFGNLVGEVGNADRWAVVSTRDLLQVRSNLFTGSDVTGQFDFDRDGVVSFGDVAIQRGCLAKSIRLITPGRSDGLW